MFMVPFYRSSIFSHLKPTESRWQCWSRHHGNAWGFFLSISLLNSSSQAKPLPLSVSGCWLSSLYLLVSPPALQSWIYSSFQPARHPANKKKWTILKLQSEKANKIVFKTFYWCNRKKKKKRWDRYKKVNFLDKVALGREKALLSQSLVYILTEEVPQILAPVS